MTNCKRVDEHLQDIDDCVFHIRKLAQSFDFPDDLEKKLNKIAETICFLSDEVEQWCDDHQYDDEDDYSSTEEYLNSWLDSTTLAALR